MLVVEVLWVSGEAGFVAHRGPRHLYAVRARAKTLPYCSHTFGFKAHGNVYALKHIRGAPGPSYQGPQQVHVVLPICRPALQAWEGPRGLAVGQPFASPVTAGPAANSPSLLWVGNIRRRRSFPQSSSTRSLAIWKPTPIYLPVAGLHQGLGYLVTHGAMICLPSTLKCYAGMQRPAESFFQSLRSGFRGLKGLLRRLNEVTYNQKHLHFDGDSSILCGGKESDTCSIWHEDLLERKETKGGRQRSNCHTKSRVFVLGSLGTDLPPAKSRAWTSVLVERPSTITMIRSMI